ncbi:MAG: polymerase sigma-70 factor, subfamily [Actinomycetota bacterium]|nr:polymerase sigma-70 factor, subfamily [Actinomycetota bacterium]
MDLLAPVPNPALPAWVRRVALGLGLLRASAPPLATGEVDTLVLARARRGDHRAFAQIVDQYDHRLRGLAFRLLGDRDRMDDVLQEAYVKAFRSLPRFKGDSALGTWLYRIVFNACADDLRSRKATVPLDDRLDVADSRPGPADVVVGRGELAAALDSLTPDQRAAVLLVDAYGLDYAEAAAVLGVATGTIGSRLNRARATLRTVLGPAPLAVQTR